MPCALFVPFLSSGLICLIFGSTLIVEVMGQFGNRDPSSYDCDKYCWVSCSQFFDNGGSEFSDCVSANVHCSCAGKFSIENPLMIFLIVAACMVSVFCICVCCIMRHRGSRPMYTGNGPTTVAQPVVPQYTPVSAAAPINSTIPYPYPYPATQGPIIVNQSQNLPAEYFPPQPYNDAAFHSGPPAPYPQWSRS